MAVYENEHQRHIAIAPIQGLEFEEDNGKVFDTLKSLTLNGPAWTWMCNFNASRNGRAALTTYYEGDAQKDRIKDNAYAAIAAAKYHGEHKRFSFDTYVTIHQEAFADLQQYGEAIAKDKRVRDLLTSIKDLSAATAKQTILANPHLQNDFNVAVTHVATSLHLNATLQDTRNISGLGSNRAPTGRGNHRGGRGGRNNRGRGHGRGCGRNIYLGSYS